MGWKDLVSAEYMARLRSSDITVQWVRLITHKWLRLQTQTRWFGQTRVSRLPLYTQWHFDRKNKQNSNAQHNFIYILLQGTWMCPTLKRLCLKLELPLLITRQQGSTVCLFLGFHSTWILHFNLFPLAPFLLLLLLRAFGVIQFLNKMFSHSVSF